MCLETFTVQQLIETISLSHVSKLKKKNKSISQKQMNIEN